MDDALLEEKLRRGLEEELVSEGDDDSVKDVEEGDEVKVTWDGGVVKKCLVAGEGTDHPPDGSTVFVHYVGKLEDGKEFESSREDGKPFKFKLGKGEVIKGWDRAVATMRKGERSEVVCTPSYGYGEQGKPPAVPGGATLVFDLELLDWEVRKDVSEKRDGKVMKRVYAEGKGGGKPEYESVARVDVVGRTEGGLEFLRRVGWEIVVGDEDLPPGAEQAVQSMREGERCDVLVHPSLCYAEDDGSGVPPNTSCFFEITLHSFDRPDSPYAAKDLKTKLEAAERRKESGNELFKAKKLRRAVGKYKRAIEFLDYDSTLSAEEKREARSVKGVCISNLAAALLALGEYEECIEECGKALEIDPQNVKALLRRARAYTLLDRWFESKRDLERVLEVNPDDADAKREMAKLKAKMKAQDEKDRKAFGNLFAKLHKMEG